MNIYHEYNLIAWKKLTADPNSRTAEQEYKHWKITFENFIGEATTLLMLQINMIFWQITFLHLTMNTFLIHHPTKKK